MNDEVSHGSSAHESVKISCGLQLVGLIISQLLSSLYLAPLGALVKSGEQLVDGLRVHLDERLAAGTGLVDLRQGSDGIGHHLRKNEEAVKW